MIALAPALNDTVPAPVCVIGAVWVMAPVPEVTLRLPLVGMVNAALKKTPPAAFSERVLPTPGGTQVSAFARVILPAWAPVEPVVTVTLLKPRAVARSATLRIELFTVGVNVPPAREPGRNVAPLEIVTFSGSSSRFPMRPPGARRSAVPVKFSTP